MDIVYYGDIAVDLANTWDPHAAEPEHLPDVAALQGWVEARFGGTSAVTETDLATVRAARGRLRAVFDADDEQEAVATLNDLMGQYPVHPVVSEHDGNEWHLHLGGDGRPVGELVAASASFGLSVLLLDVGFDRRGVCSDERCSDAFVDTSRNRSRRYCSTTCSNRANVAAFRARRRSGDSATPDTAGDRPGSQ